MTVADEVMELMDRRGGDAYFGESVSQREHALQAAWLARQAGSPHELVLAALLHDVGHLLGGPEHEVAGYEWLLVRFGPGVAEPVRHHVAAKRYLCRVEPEYMARLSPASIESLELQGGPFDEAEEHEFEGLPCFHEAVMLRRWDDEAKTPGLIVPGMEEYLMPNPTQSLDEIKRAMASTNDIFNSEVFAKGNLDALDRVYTADARILPPGAPLISGRPAIKEFWAGLIKAVTAKSAVLTSIDVMPAGDGVVEIGKAVIGMEPEGQAAGELEVKYVVCWQKEDGHWKWHIDIWNTNA